MTQATIPAKVQDSLVELLRRIRDAKIYHALHDHREGAISIDVVVPGERWEIDLLDDGRVDVEIFRSDGEIHDKGKLDDLFQRFSD